MDAIYAHPRCDDLDLDARSQWVGKGQQKSTLCMLSATKQKISIIKLVTTVGHFCVTLTLQTFTIWLDHLVSFQINTILYCSSLSSFCFRSVPSKIEGCSRWSHPDAANEAKEKANGQHPDIRIH